MKDRKRNTKGAVSVFLAIILVPCIVVSSLFVDASRVSLSRAVSESAADLALNTLLTNYDADLKEWYGLVSSCQNISEFYEVSANYFIRALRSQGMSDEEILLLSDYYSEATGDDTIHDLLKVECVDAVPTIGPVEGANLANASMMKDQIVEFMKYRGPIEITTGLIARLQSDSTASEAFQAKVNEPLVEDKQNFYEAEGKFTEAAYYSYYAIYSYYIEAQKNKFSNDTLMAEYSRLTEFKTAYQDIVKYLVKNLSNTTGMDRYNRYTISKTYYNDYYSNPSKKFSEVYSKREKVDEVYVYYINIKDVKDLVDDLKKKIEEFNTAKTNFENAARPVLNELPYGAGVNQANPIQWWVRMNNAVNSSNGHTEKIERAAQEMMRAYSRVLAIDSCELEGNIPTGWNSLADWKTKYSSDDLIRQVESLHATYLTAGVRNDNDTYLHAVRELESVSSSQKGNINAANLYVTVDGQRKNVNEALSYISSTLSSRRTELQKYVDLLDTAIDGDGGNTPALDSLMDYADNYDTTLEEWKDSAAGTTYNGQQTTMAGKDQKEITELDAKYDISEDGVKELKTRLVNIRSQIQAAISAIDSMKFGSQMLKDISGVNTLISSAGINSSQIKLKNGELDSYANTIFNDKFSPGTLPGMEHSNDDNYNPSINPETGAVKTPSLFVYLHDNFKNKPKGEIDKAKSEKDSAKDTSNKKAEEAKNKGYRYGGENVAHDYSVDDPVNPLTLADGLIGTIENLLTLDFTGMRDDLYVTTYLMEMFSYATFENEGLYQLVDEEKRLDLSITSTSANYYDTVYKTVMGEKETDRETWSSTDPEDTYNKSMTNKMINKAHNAAYCAEVEYILFGGPGKTNEENIKAVYNSIYAIRYGLNLVSGFHHFWTANSKEDLTAYAIQMVAVSVAAATGGIVPEPVTKAVLIPILAVFETAVDLDRLEAGFPVELYKLDQNQWWISLSDGDSKGISSFVSKLGKGELAQNTDSGLFYRDYLTLFVYLGLSSSKAEGMYQRIGEVIQFNIRTMSGKNDYTMKNAQMYFQLDAKLRVEPLMITLPYFSYDEYSNQLTTKTDWCTYDIHLVRGYS